MFLLISIALGQDCTLQSVVAGFPLGVVPASVRSLAVVSTDCTEVTAVASVFDGRRLVHREDVVPEREQEFMFFPFTAEQLPVGVDLVFELELSVAGEPELILGGVYSVDPERDDVLEGRPQLGDLLITQESTEGGVVFEASAAVLPATTAPEAFFLWRTDGVLRAVTVSTQPRPILRWAQETSAEKVCIEVEEVGVDGTRAVSEPRCTSFEGKPCGCEHARAGWSLMLWLGVVAFRRRATPVLSPPG